MSSMLRLQRELTDIKESQPDFLLQVSEQEGNLYKWEVLVAPSNPAYSKGAYRLKIEFPPEYPFKPPAFRMTTPIYHPNIDKNGNPCLQILSQDNWKPSVRIKEALIAMVYLIDNPDASHPVRADIAELLMNNPKKFQKKAEEWHKKYAEPLP